MLPLDTDDGVRIDVIFALLPFELDAIRRARDVSVAGWTVRVVTVEDLILMKIISERPRDVADAEALVRRRARDLDRDYLEPRVRELATALERSGHHGPLAGVDGRVTAANRRIVILPASVGMLRHARAPTPRRPRESNTA